MTATLEQYVDIVGAEVVDQLRQLAEPLKGLRLVHVNSTRVGGGVAEILNNLVPLMRELGIEASWDVIEGDAPFYDCTKSFHNALQGNRVNIPERLLRAYEETNERNAERLRPTLEEADVVIIHDPQPAPLLSLMPARRGKWIWRCHIDVSHPYRPVWRYLRNFLAEYDGSVFSLAGFAQPLPHVQYLMQPSIDALSEKNIELDPEEVRKICATQGVDLDRSLIVQVSRFDRFKDPIGVIQAYRLAKRFQPRLQCVLAGGSATDDPEGEAVLQEARQAAGEDADLHVLDLEPDAHRTINALQRAADIVVQKSIKEGFGLTVAEAMWKSRPVIGGDTGGIRLQVFNHHTGFLVSTPEGAALRLQYLLRNHDIRTAMGKQAREFVRENYLLTRNLREYLTLILGVMRGRGDRIEIG